MEERLLGRSRPDARGARRRELRAGLVPVRRGDRARGRRGRRLLRARRRHRARRQERRPRRGGGAPLPARRQVRRDGLLEDTTRRRPCGHPARSRRSGSTGRSSPRSCARIPRCGRRSRRSRTGAPRRTSSASTRLLEPPERGARAARRRARAGRGRGGRGRRRGRPAGPMYVVEEGRLRASVEEDGEAGLRYLRSGDFFGELSLHAPSRARRPWRRSRRPAAPPHPRTSPALCAYPEFRTRLEERIAQYEYRGRPRAARLRRGDPAGRLPRARAGRPRPGRAAHAIRERAAAAAFEGGTPSSRAAPNPPGASRTSARSTRWTAAPPAWRWSAATSAARSASRASASSCTRRRTARAWRASRAGADGAGPGRAGGQRVEEPARRDAAAGDRALGGRPLGRALRRRRRVTCGSPTRRSACAGSRAPSS